MNSPTEPPYSPKVSTSGLSFKLATPLPAQLLPQLKNAKLKPSNTSIPLVSPIKILPTSSVFRILPPPEEPVPKSKPRPVRSISPQSKSCTRNELFAAKALLSPSKEAIASLRSKNVTPTPPYSGRKSDNSTPVSSKSIFPHVMISLKDWIWYPLELPINSKNCPDPVRALLPPKEMVAFKAPRSSSSNSKTRRKPKLS